MEALVSSLAKEGGFASQTQPTPAQITFRILKTIHTGVGWVWLNYLKLFMLRLVGSGLRNYARGSGYHVYKDIWESSTGEQLVCQRENGNCADLFAVVAVKRLF